MARSKLKINKKKTNRDKLLASLRFIFDRKKGTKTIIEKNDGIPSVMMTYPDGSTDDLTPMYGSDYTRNPIPVSGKGAKRVTTQNIYTDDDVFRKMQQAVDYYPWKNIRKQ